MIWALDSKINKVMETKSREKKKNLTNLSKDKGKI